MFVWWANLAFEERDGMDATVVKVFARGGAGSGQRESELKVLLLARSSAPRFCLSQRNTLGRFSAQSPAPWLFPRLFYRRQGVARTSVSRA
jgi:hypothetical protein